jgi:uncharacterized protein (TIGR02172 family)
MNIGNTLENDRLTITLTGRIDTNNAAEAEKQILAVLKEHPSQSPVFDAAGLEYISSAGLRVLMKVRKSVGKKVTIENVSRDVYDIFETTGFTEILDVQKALRQISIEGCEAIGQGANGVVYRLTPDTMVKVYQHGAGLDVVNSEREISRRVFLMGVPSAIAFDTVRCGDAYGAVYELLDGATVTERIRANPEKLEDYARRMGEMTKEIHQIEIPDGVLPPAINKLYESIDRIASWFTPEEVEQLRSVYHAIPDQNFFVHNDLHSKNVMEAGGEFVLIDLGDVGSGSPLIDLIHTQMVFLEIGNNAGPRKPDEMGFNGLTYGEMDRFWDVYAEAYFGSREKAQKVTQKLAPYARFMYLTSSMGHPILPDSMRPAMADGIRKEILPKVEQLCQPLSI